MNNFHEAFFDSFITKLYNVLGSNLIFYHVPNNFIYY
jgi:hypothetical protein